MTRTKKSDIIIIGAGASGLMAAANLAKKGWKVLVLEGRNRTGGRIQTFNTAEYHRPLEAGAEFIHGSLPVTLKLCKQALQQPIEIGGNMFTVNKGNWTQETNFIEDENLVVKKLRQLKSDISITNFLETYFSAEQYAGLRKSLLSYVEGYYAGDPALVSAKTFLYEYECEEAQQYRPANGYGPLINFLENEIKKHGGEIKLSTIVKQVYWQKNNIVITDACGTTYAAIKLITTIPLGVWKAHENEQCAIKFSPDLLQKREALSKLGFGSAIKLLLTFTGAFWQQEQYKPNTGFIFSDAVIGTWWTQFPTETPLLTGWIAGPATESFAHYTNEMFFNEALQSLAYLFKMDINVLKKMNTSFHVYNWSHDPFCIGAYSYSTINREAACNAMMQPVEDTLYFAGEALYNGTEMGTVEAALISGQRVANEIGNKPVDH